MPVTAKLSKRFYDTFGDEIVNELVEWFNQLDARSRDDLFRINELNYARFEAKLEQRIAELRTEMVQRFAEFREAIEKDFAARFAAIDKRFDQLYRMMILGWITLIAALVALR